ncbi:MAG TPA: ATP-binding protein [Candidatus Saccharimonadales bacterium]|jgi:hypothetical protein
MTTFIIILLFLIVAAAVAGPIMYSRYRKKFREFKDFERGLKMVPLFIHLPPPSDDTQSNGRDVRDLTDENISKATIIYNIIASTIQKGFKSKFYGQRHFTFEVVGSQGFVYFYAAVPIALVDVVKQAVISAYPSARLEEAAEHNIFNAVGKMSGTVGGEFNLKNSFAYPIATYQDLKRDAMQSLLNALSTLDKEDGAGIQILMRPADPSWRKEASAIASNKRKGKDNKSGFEAVWPVIKSLVMAFVQPPGGDKGEKDKPKELSAMEQSVLDSIDEKTRHPGYEVLIRVVASSNVSGRAQAILTNIVATFSLYDAPGKNGFKYSATKDMESFVTSYIMRFFPQRKKKNILNAVELATVFHFPDQRSIPTSQLTRQASKQVDAPRNMPDDGMLLGYNLFRGAKKPIRLALGDRQRHMYAVGQTGTGKSTFLENLALQDMINGDGFAFIDPHGDTAEKLLSMVPKERTEDVIYFSPADMDYPMGLNLFEFSNPDQKDFLIQETLNMLQKLYDPQHQGIMGPRYEHIFRNAALVIMADPKGGTFVDIPKLFVDPQYLKQKLQHVTDQSVLDFWLKEFPASQRSNDGGEVTAWFVSKFGAFMSNQMMRNIIGQTKSAIDLRDIMDNKKILLVNLSKGRTGDLNSKLLGMIFVMRFQAAAMSRANIPESERQDFCLYVDEFQNFSTDSFATIMSEARKYHLNLIVANQFTTQLTPEIRDAVFGNMGTVVSFRVGQQDVESLAKYFQPTFDDSDLLRIPSYNAIVRTLTGGVPTNPFSMSTLPPLGNPNPKLAEALKQLSAAKYGRPRAEVEKDIFGRMASPVDPGKPAGFGAGAGPAGAPAAGQRSYAPPAANATSGWGSAGVTASPAAQQRQPFANAASPAMTQTTAASGQPYAGSGTQPAYGQQPVYSQPYGQPPAQSHGRPFGQASAPTAHYPAQPVDRPRPAAPAPSTFLDDWLAKRSVAAPQASAPSNSSNAAISTAPQPSYASAAPASQPQPMANTQQSDNPPSQSAPPQADSLAASTPPPQAETASTQTPLSSENSVSTAAPVSQAAASPQADSSPVNNDADSADSIYIDENGVLQTR